MNLTKEGGDAFNCPGENIMYKCSIQSTYDNLHLTWKVIFPGITSFNFVYNQTSIPDIMNNLTMNIITTLTKFIPGEHIESIMVLTVLRNTTLNNTILECIFESFVNDTATIVLNMTPGMYYLVMLIITRLCYACVELLDKQIIP